MQVVFFGTTGDYTMKPFLAAAARHSIVGIVESAHRGSNGMSLSLEDKLYDLLQATAGKPTLWTFASRKRIPYFYLNNQTMPGLAAFLHEISPEVGCIASLNQLLPEAIIGIFPKGIINFHPSLLPKYRGPNVWFWMYYQAERQGGVTIHYIDKGEDTGDIIRQAAFEIKPGMPPKRLMETAIQLGSSLMVEALEDIASGNVETISQRQLRCPLRARYIKEDEDLFPWRAWSLEQTYHFLNGAAPWYNAFKHIQGSLRWLVWGVKGFETRQNYKNNGKICLDWKGAYFSHPDGRIRLGLKISGLKRAAIVVLVMALLYIVFLRLM